MKQAQGKIELVFILIVLAMLASVIFLPQISQLTGFAAAGQENLITIEKNLVTAVNLSTYMPGIERTYLATSPSNIDVQIKDTLLVLTPDKDFTGERILKVFVADQEVQELVFRIEVVSKKNAILEKIKEEYEQKEEVYVPPPEPEPESEVEPEPEDIIPGNVLFISKSEKLHVSLSSYFETEGPYVATGDIDLIVIIEEDLMTIEPYLGFIGEEEITVSSIGDVLEEHAFLVKVGESKPKEDTKLKEKEKEEPKNISKEEDITVDGKKFGEKIEDEPGFEVFFKNVTQNNETLEILFYHDSNKSEKVYVEGDVNYTLSTNLSNSYVTVNLTVILDDGIAPQFELHVGDTSEKFKFGKKIPKVKLKEKYIKKFKNKNGNKTWYKVIDRDDELVDVLIQDKDASVYIKGVNVTDVNGLFDWVTSTILTTEIFAADPIDMEEAVITLPRTDEVTAIVECPDFNLTSRTCPSDWIVTQIPFTKTDTHINFTVDHFSGYGGGKIQVIDVQSYPSVGGTWRVRFNTTGTANLTITPLNGTNWTNYSDTGYDLKFLEVTCGNQTLNYTWINNSVFIPNYNCSSLGVEISKVITTGAHTLEFKFGQDVDYAHNIALTGIINPTSDNIYVDDYGAVYAEAQKVGGSQLMCPQGTITTTGCLVGLTTDIVDIDFVGVYPGMDMSYIDVLEVDFAAPFFTPNWCVSRWNVGPGSCNLAFTGTVFGPFGPFTWSFGPFSLANEMFALGSPAQEYTFVYDQGINTIYDMQGNVPSSGGIPGTTYTVNGVGCPAIIGEKIEATSYNVPGQANLLGGNSLWIIDNTNRRLVEVAEPNHPLFPWPFFGGAVDCVGISIFAPGIISSPIVELRQTNNNLTEPVDSLDAVSNPLGRNWADLKIIDTTGPGVGSVHWINPGAGGVASITGSAANSMVVTSGPLPATTIIGGTGFGNPNEPINYANTHASGVWITGRTFDPTLQLTGDVDADLLFPGTTPGPIFGELYYGANLTNTDSDAGGEQDGSEDAGGRDPIDPADDVAGIPCGPLFASTNLTNNVTAPGTCFTINASSITLDCKGYTINGGGIGNGIEAISKTGITIKNCVIQGFVDGIYLRNVNNSLVDNNTIHTIASFGIDFSLTAGDNNDIQNNYIYDCTGADGIFLQVITNSRIDNNQIRNCRIGIYSTTSHHNNITNNEVNLSHTYDGITVGNSSNTLVQGNTLFDNARGGIWVDATSRRNTIKSNSVNQNWKSFGLALYNPSGGAMTGHVVQDNNVSNVWSYPILLENADNNVFERNDITGGYIYGFTIQGGSTGNNITNQTWSNTQWYSLTLAGTAALQNIFKGSIAPTSVLTGASVYHIDDTDGTLTYLQPINLTQSTLLSSFMSFTPNNIFVNTTARPQLNRAAITDFNNNYWARYDVVTQKDNDDGIFKTCNPPDCNLTQYGGGNTVWQVNGFSNYRAANNTPPTQGIPLLTASTAGNDTSDTLTVYNQSTSDVDNHTVYNIINWYRNSTSISVLNMPFDYQSLDLLGTNTDKTYDFSGYSNTGDLESVGKVMVDSCNSSAGWVANAGAVTSTAVDKIEGNASCALSKTNAGTVDCYYGKVVGATNMANQYIAVWVNVNNATTLSKVNYFQIYLANAGWASFAWKDFQLNTNNLTVGWNLLYFNTGNPTGTSGAFNAAAVTDIRLDVDTNQATDLYPAGAIKMDYWFLSPSNPRGPRLRSGIQGNAYRFDGVSDIINISDSPSLNFGNGSFSLEAWFNASNVSSGDQNIYFKLGSIFTGFALYIDGAGSPGNIWFRVLGTAGNAFSITAGTDYRDNLWHHVVATYNPVTGSETYVDGVLQASNVSVAGNTTNNGNLFIGVLPFGPTYFNGTIDELRIYNHTLSAQQVLAQYNAGTPKYDSIVPQETAIGDIWQACMTPNDGIEVGLTNCSNNITIQSNQPPTQDPPILNATSVNNLTSDNLTVYPQNVTDPENNSVTNITNWYKDGADYTNLNMPFDTNNATTAKDYSTYSNNGVVSGATWTSSGISGGAYEFDGVNNNIIVPQDSTVSFDNDFSIGFWVRPRDSNNRPILGKAVVAGLNSGYNYYLRTTILNKMDFIIVPAGMVGGTTSVASVSNYTLNQWQYVVGTYKNSTHNMSIYINGTLDNSVINTMVGGPPTSNFDVAIGRTPPGPLVATFFYNGSIDEVKMYNHTLTPEQVAANYNAGAPTYTKIVSQETERGEAWYVDTTPNDAALDGITKLSNGLQVSNAPTQTPPVLTSSLGYNSTSENLLLAFNVSDIDGDAVYNITNWFRNGTSLTVLNMPFTGLRGMHSVATDDMLALYFENNTRDFSGYDNDWNCTNCPAYTTAGQVGGAYVYNGVTDTLNIADDPSLNLPNDITISAWVNLASNNICSVLSKQVGLNINYRLFFNGNTFGYATGAGGIGTQRVILATTVATTGQWYHVVATRNGTSSNMSIYVNGVKENEIVGAAVAVIGTPLFIGSTSGAGGFLNGTIDELHIINRTLNPTEVEALYKKGLDSTKDVYDYSPLRNKGTVTGATQITGGVIGDAYVFDGVNDGISVPDDSSLNLSENFSIEVWIKPRKLGGAGTQYILDKGIAGLNLGHNYALYINTFTNRTIFAIHGTAAFPPWAKYAVGTVNTLKTNQWYHIVATFVNSTHDMRIYLNGSFEANTTSNWPGGPPLYPTPLSIGRPSTIPVNLFNGTIDEVKIYNHTLTPAQIAVNYNAGAPKYDKIASSETATGDIWYAEATPNDGVMDGETKRSNNLTIQQYIPITCGAALQSNVNNYAVVTNLTTLGNCFDVSNLQNVAIDCRGHRITGPATTNTFLYASVVANNITLKNCFVQDFQYGVYRYFSNSVFHNNTFNSTYTTGIRLRTNDNNNVTFNNIWNTQLSTSYGLYIIDADNTKVYNNNFTNVGGYDIYARSTHNEIKHNYFDKNNIASRRVIWFPALTSSALVENNTIVNIGTSWGYYMAGITNPVSLRGTNLVDGKNATNYYMYNRTNEVVQNLNNDGSEYVLNLAELVVYACDNLTINNSIFANHPVGAQTVRLYDTNNTFFKNNTVSGDTQAFQMTNGRHNFIENNNIQTIATYAASTYALQVDGTASDSMIRGNTISRGRYVISTLGTPNNVTFYNNTLNNIGDNQAYGAFLNGGNVLFDNNSITCTQTNSNGIATQGTSVNWVSNNTVNGCQYGFRFFNGGNDVHNNTFINPTYFGIYLGGNTDLLHRNNITRDNMVNGNPVQYYWKEACPNVNGLTFNLSHTMPTGFTLVDMDHCLVDNATFIGVGGAFNGGGEAGLSLINSSYSNVTNSNFSNLFEGIGFYNRDEPAENIFIAHNYFGPGTNNAYGIRYAHSSTGVRYKQNHTIYNNTFIGKRYGIYMDPYTGFTYVNRNITGNLFNGSTLSDIYSSSPGAQNVTIERNRFDKFTGSYGIYWNVAGPINNILIKDNNFTNGGINSIYLQLKGLIGNNITGNYFNGSKYAIAIESGTHANNAINNNEIYNANTAGIYVNDLDHQGIYKNTICYNKAPITFAAGSFSTVGFQNNSFCIINLNPVNGSNITDSTPLLSYNATNIFNNDTTNCTAVIDSINSGTNVTLLADGSNQTLQVNVTLAPGPHNLTFSCIDNMSNNASFNQIVFFLGGVGPLNVNTTHPDINVFNYRLDNQKFSGLFETVNASCTNCTYDLENVCQLEQEVITAPGNVNMTLFLNGTAVNMQKLELICTMYDYAKNNLNGANCSGSNDNSSVCANWTGGGNVFRIDLTNASNFNTAILLGNITPVANCSTVVCYMNATWAPGDDQEFTINKTFTIWDATGNATNPNGTLRFSTDKYASIDTDNPDINILNMRLDFQSFNGTFNTGSGLCSGCQYDLSNGTCQAEIEQVFGMFQNYNLTMTLTTAAPINMNALSFVCRTANETVQANPGCAGLFSAVGTGQPGCMNWVATAGRSTVLAGNAGLSINLTGFTNITIPLGTISPTQNCKVIACEINGSWVSGDTQEFIMNKTITARAI